MLNNRLFYGQVHFVFLLVPGQVENFTISTPELINSAGQELTLVLQSMDLSFFENNVDPDQLVFDKVI